ncbi:membrane-associated protein, putative [Bodo saltans]|uniref:Membrane-associated protein, putative n=1 Tax=Bodo saltans TaxID=75058 RepID=A0A0S4JQS4_BODSA|nr:membrane-associated protein, putative [Bodo saltans]|eukprot:CUG91399.1 membrane-associated protein, putative [Bodo saltans]
MNHHLRTCPNCPPCLHQQRRSSAPTTQQPTFLRDSVMIAFGSVVVLLFFCLAVFVADATPCPGLSDPTQTISSGNTYSFLNCPTSNSFLAMTLAPTTSDGGFNGVLKDIAIQFAGGAYFPQLYLDTTAVTAHIPWLIRNITITFQGVQSTNYFGTIVSMILSAAPLSTITNIYIQLTQCTLPYELSSSGIDLRAYSVTSVTISTQDCALPWQQDGSLVSMVTTGGLMTDLMVTMSNLFTNPPTAPPSVAGRTHSGQLVSLQSINSSLPIVSLSMSYVAVTLVGIDMSALEGAGGVLLLYSGKIQNSAIRVSNLVLPKSVTRRSFVMQALDASTGVSFIVDNMSDASSQYVAPQALIDDLVTNTSALASFAFTTLFITGNIFDVIISIQRLTLRRPSLREASFASIRGAYVRNLTLRVINTAIANSVMEAPPSSASMDAVGDCNGAFLCLNVGAFINISLLWNALMLDTISCTVPLLSFSTQPITLTFTNVRVEMSNWHLTGSSSMTLNGGWIVVAAQPYVEAALVGTNATFYLTNVSMKLLGGDGGGNAVVQMSAPAMLFGWSIGAAELLSSGGLGLTSVSGVRIECWNISGTVQASAPFVAVVASGSVTNVSVVMTRCELTVASVGCAFCSSLAGRASHVVLGQNVLTSVSVDVTESFLNGSTNYLDNGYTMSIVNLVGPVGQVVPTVVWSNINVTILSSKIVSQGPASIIVNWWYVYAQNKAHIVVKDTILIQRATSGKFSFQSGAARCSLLQIQPFVADGAVTVRNVSATYFSLGGVPDAFVGLAVGDSSSGQLLVVGALQRSTLTVSNTTLNCRIEGGTLTPSFLPLLLTLPATNQISVQLVVLDPRTVSHDCSVSVDSSVVDSYGVVHIVASIITGILASCVSFVVAGNCTRCMFTVSGCTLSSNNTLSSASMIPKPRIVAPIFFQPLGRLLTSTLGSETVALFPNLAVVMSTLHISCTVLITNTVMLDNSPPTSLVFAAFLQPADVSQGYQISILQSTTVPAMRGSMALSDFPVYAAAGCFCGCSMNNAMIVVDAVAGLMPSVWALTGGAMVLSGQSQLLISGNTLNCSYHVPLSAASFLHTTNCSVIRYVSNAIGSSIPGTLEMQGVSFIQVARNTFIGKGHTNALLATAASGVLTTGTMIFSSSSSASWRMGCNVIGIEVGATNFVSLPGRLTPRRYFDGIDRLIFPPSDDLAVSFHGAMCRAPSGAETQTMSIIHEPPLATRAPTVTVVITATTAQTWSMVGAGLVGPASGAATAVMSRVQAAFTVLALRDRCNAYLQSQAAAAEGGNSASSGGSGIVFGSNAMDNPLGLDLSDSVSGDAALVLGTLVGNTLLVMVCVVTAFIMTHLVKPLLHHRLCALEARLHATYGRSSMDSTNYHIGGAKNQRKKQQQQLPLSAATVRRWLGSRCNLSFLALTTIRGLIRGIDVLPSEPFPGSMYTSYTLLLQPSVTAALLLVAFSNSGQTGSAVGLVLGVVWLIPWCWFFYIILLRIRPLPLTTKPTPCKRRGISRWKRVLELVFTPNELWTPPQVKASDESTQNTNNNNNNQKQSRSQIRREFGKMLFHRYICIFDVYRRDRHYFFFVELLGAVFLGVIGAAALGVPPQDACAAAVWGSACVIGASCALLLAVCVLRPHTVRFDLIVLVSGTVLAIISEVASLENSNGVGDVLTAVTAWSQVLFLVFNLFAEWLEGEAGRNRRRIVVEQQDKTSVLRVPTAVTTSSSSSSFVRTRRNTEKHIDGVGGPHSLAPFDDVDNNFITRLSEETLDMFRHQSRPELFLELAIREICEQREKHS